MKHATHDIVIVGAGIIGVAIACELQGRGRKVLLLDREEPGRGASYGNMASIAVTEFMPASRPGIWSQMPRWLLDPEGPIRIRPSYLLKLLPWSMRFIAASRPGKLRALEAAGAVLCQRALGDTESLLAAAGLGHMLSTTGCLSLYANEKEYRSDRDHIELLERFGFSHQILDEAALHALEPALDDVIKKAVLFPDNRSISDPYRMLKGLVERFRSLGGDVGKGEVLGFEHRDGGVTHLKLENGGTVPAPQLVLAAGAHTGRLSRLLGEPMPLETERGYHAQIQEPGIALHHSIIWPARAFMVTPTAGGIRVGGTVELAGLDAPPDYRRAEILLKRAKEALPGLEIGQSTPWMGHRPAFPDTIPVMSRSRKWKNLFYAAGHGHLGLTYAATTGLLMADLVTGATPPVDLEPYRIDRF